MANTQMHFVALIQGCLGEPEPDLLKKPYTYC